MAKSNNHKRSELFGTFHPSPLSLFRCKKNCRSRRSRLPKQGRLSHAGLDVSSKSTTALRFQKGNIMLKLET